MLETAWYLPSTGALYQDPGADYFERRQDPAIEAKRLQHRIEALGFAVTIAEKAAKQTPRQLQLVLTHPTGAS
jgi:hypothetical protein